MADPETLAIERVAFDAWPAAEVRVLGGWRLRFNHGVTNRGSFSGSRTMRTLGTRGR